MKYWTSPGNAQINISCKRNFDLKILKHPINSVMAPPEAPSFFSAQSLSCIYNHYLHLLENHLRPQGSTWQLSSWMKWLKEYILIFLRAPNSWDYYKDNPKVVQLCIIRSQKMSVAQKNHLSKQWPTVIMISEKDLEADLISDLIGQTLAANSSKGPTIKNELLRDWYRTGTHRRKLSYHSFTTIWGKKGRNFQVKKGDEQW